MNDPKLIEACKRVIESVGNLWKASIEPIRHHGQYQNAWDALKHNAEVLGSLIDIVGYNKEPENRPDWLRCANCLAWNGTGCEHWLDGRRRTEGRCMNWHCKTCLESFLRCFCYSD